MDHTTVHDRHAAAAGSVDVGESGGILRRFRRSATARCTTSACWWGAASGVAPHVLHHVGPLAGTALVAGAGGTLLFGALGFVATIPWLWRLRRRSGGWRSPSIAFGAFVGLFLLSTFVIGPAIAGDTDTPPLRAPRPADVHPHDHG